MNSKIKKVVCVVIAVLIIAAIVLIVFCVSKANKAYHDYMFYLKYLDQSPYLEIHLNNFIMFVGIAIFALLTLLSNGFLLFLFLKNSNALEYVKLSVSDIKEMRREKSKAKQEKKKQKLQSKLNEINQKTV